MGQGQFPPPQPSFLTFVVTQKVYFFFSAKIECWYLGLNDLNSTQRLTLGVDELEVSRMLCKWGKLLQFRGSWILILFRGILRGFLVVTQSLVLERSLGRLKARKEKLFSTCSFYHNLIVKVGVLHLLCSCCSRFSCCFMLGSCSSFVLIIGMLVCMLGMFGRDC